MARVGGLVALLFVLGLAGCAGAAQSPGGLVDGGRSYTQPAPPSESRYPYDWLEGGGG